MPISHDISSHVLPYEHHIFNKYGNFEHVTCICMCFDHCIIKKFFGFVGKKSYIWFGPTPRAYVADPELIKEILLRPNEFRRPQHEPLRDSIIGGLVVSEGHKWAKHRHIINPSLSS
ncbi:putative 11-oxo-beta-amyrin 30-oxidase [Helianthus annuus]|nr:putative 11-oxo-beta-amyrin 30-oxidase [Helianthus annuus]